MPITNNKERLRQNRIYRIRKKVAGTAERPRLCVHFSNKHIYAQAINDDAGVTLLQVTTHATEIRGEKPTDKNHSNGKSATALGKMFAERAIAQGIKSVVFDRNGRRYHGTVKAFAEAARAGGLQF